MHHALVRYRTTPRTIISIFQETIQNCINVRYRSFSQIILFLGVYLHSLVLTAFHNGSGITKMKYFAPFGWLMPLVITIIWIVANHKYRDKESICWDSNLSKFILIGCNRNIYDMTVVCMLYVEFQPQVSPSAGSLVTWLNRCW